MYSDCCTCMHSKQRLLDCLSQSVFFSSCVKVCNEFGMISVVVVDVWVAERRRVEPREAENVLCM